MALFDQVDLCLNRHSLYAYSSEEAFERLSEALKAVMTLANDFAESRAIIHYLGTPLSQQIFAEDYYWDDFLAAIPVQDYEFLCYVSELDDKSLAVNPAEVKSLATARVEGVTDNDTDIFLFCHDVGYYLLSCSAECFKEDYVEITFSKNRRAKRINNIATEEHAIFHCQVLENIDETCPRTFNFYETYKLHIYVNDHGPAHGHAVGPEAKMKIEIADPTQLFGRGSRKVKGKLVSYVSENKENLLQSWEKLNPGVR
ncbi:MAG: DUF4160 domain-containing protein [Halodesulfovibrio sp.]|uniref:DUF4160 domain-containing protein n=1 Tax=Halodesulfovibrio sp. TaxID=1912772 RepID=UPI00359E72DE